MNYYIEANPGKAEQIKAAFESKGFDVGTNSCAQKGLYFTFDGKVCYTDDYVYPRDMMLKRFIKNNPDYKELELPFEPKFKAGDWLFHNTRGAHPILVKDYSERQGYNVECIRTSYYLQKGVIENEYHLWTIADAKDGDVLATDNGWTCIFQAFDGYLFSSYCFMDSQKWFCESGSEVHTLDSSINGKIYPATKEQSDLLFAKMREAGYEWDADKKELRKIQPHYGIANFHAGMPVLVRETSLNAWQYVLFSHYYIGGDGLTRFNAGLVGFTQCIPFEGNEKLLGTTDMCNEQYINW